jgi:hypothetical protein
MTTPQKITPQTEFKLGHQYIFCKEENSVWDGVFVIYKEHSEEGVDKNIFFRSYFSDGYVVKVSLSLQSMAKQYTHYIPLNQNA